MSAVSAATAVNPPQCVYAVLNKWAYPSYRKGQLVQGSRLGLKLFVWIICFREPLLVSLLDGSVFAIDQESGSRLWTFASGFPLVSASGATDYGKQGDSGSRALSKSSRTIFPGIDGALYSYRQDGGITRGLEVRPLVSNPTNLCSTYGIACVQL